jgi:hypothetical protein
LQNNLIILCCFDYAEEKRGKREERKKGKTKGKEKEKKGEGAGFGRCLPCSGCWQTSCTFLRALAPGHSSLSPLLFPLSVSPLVCCLSALFCPCFSGPSSVFVARFSRRVGGERGNHRRFELEEEPEDALGGFVSQV